MKHVHLTDDLTQRDRDVLDLLRDLQNLQAPRPYETTVQSLENTRLRYVLSTTSKDLYLSLGRLGSFSQRTFCLLLEAGYKAGNDPQMAFSFDPEDGQPKQRTIFIARTEGHDLLGEIVTFNLAPGH